MKTKNKKQIILLASRIYSQNKPEFWRIDFRKNNYGYVSATFCDKDILYSFDTEFKVEYTQLESGLYGCYIPLYDLYFSAPTEEKVSIISQGLVMAHFNHYKTYLDSVAMDKMLNKIQDIKAEESNTNFTNWLFMLLIIMFASLWVYSDINWTRCKNEFQLYRIYH